MWTARALIADHATWLRAGIDARRRAGDEVALVGVARLVLAPCGLERLDRLAHRVAIAGQPNREERIERLHDDDEIARRHIAIDESRAARRARDRCWRRCADVVLVEKNREQPRLVLAGRRAARRRPMRTTIGAGGPRARRDAHEPDRLDALQ